MKNNHPKVIRFRRITAIVGITVIVAATPLLADGPNDEPTAEERVFGGAVGLVGGTAVGGGLGWAWDRSSSAPESLDEVAEAEKELAEKRQPQLAREARREQRFQRQVEKVRKIDPQKARIMEAEHAGYLVDRKEAKVARRLRKQKEILPAVLKFSENKAGEQRYLAAKAAKDAKLAKKGLKMGTTLKGAVAGGVVGMAAGAALGVDVPDAVDGAMFAGKLISDPEHADELIVDTAKDGVKMAKTVATTITDPAKMARNLGNAVHGVSDDIASIGLFKSKDSVKATVDENGECHTNSIWYRCQLQNARNQNAGGMGGTNHSFFRPIDHTGQSIAGRISHGGRTLDHEFTRADRSMRRSFSQVDRHVFRPVGRTIGTGFSNTGKTFDRTLAPASRSLDSAFKTVDRQVFRPIGHTFDKASQSIGRSIQRESQKFNHTVNQTTRKVGLGLKTFLGIRR